MNLKLKMLVVFLLIISVICFIQVKNHLNTNNGSNSIKSFEDKIQVLEENAVNVDDLDHLPNRDVLISKYLNQIQIMNNEKLPFDEPLTEYGQQDGKLRPLWLNAYRNKRYKYRFNGDNYYTSYVDKDTNRVILKIPQVCSDYITDSIERSLGNGYYPSIKSPKDISGNFSIVEQAKKENLDLRKLNHLVLYFQSHPEHFEFVFNGIGPKIGKPKELKLFLKDNNVELGDIIIIHGKVPWDSKEYHSHSFIVTKLKDGYADKVSGNAGISQEWSINSESYRTPHRRIQYIIRLRNEFLELMK